MLQSSVLIGQKPSFEIDGQTETEKGQQGLGHGGDPKNLDQRRQGKKANKIGDLSETEVKYVMKVILYASEIQRLNSKIDTLTQKNTTLESKLTSLSQLQTKQIHESRKLFTNHDQLIQKNHQLE